MTTLQESVSYQANVDWADASTVWHAVDGVLSYIRYLFATRSEVGDLRESMHMFSPDKDIGV